ncbi:unnamed protein product [Agarophyton chilense]
MPPNQSSPKQIPPRKATERNRRPSIVIKPHDLPDHPSRDIISLSNGQLRAIFAFAAAHLTEDIEYEESKPLSGVLDLRDTISNQTDPSPPDPLLSPSVALANFTNTPADKLIDMAKSDLARLTTLLKASSNANEDLIPMNLDSDEKHDILATAFAWRSQCYETFYEDILNEHKKLKMKFSQLEDASTQPSAHGTKFLSAAARTNGIASQLCTHRILPDPYRTPPLARLLWESHI